MPHAELAKRGIASGLVEARSSVRDMPRTEGVEEKTGRIDRFKTLADAIEAFQNGNCSKIMKPKAVRYPRTTTNFFPMRLLWVASQSLAIS
jgi:hypothetical protein